MVAFGAGAGLHKMSLEHFVVPENKEVTMIITTKRQAYHKEIITNLKGFPLAKSWKSWVSKNSESEVAQSRPTLCDPKDCSLPGSSVRGILQARILEWVAISKNSNKL